MKRQSALTLDKFQWLQSIILKLGGLHTEMPALSALDDWLDKGDFILCGISTLH